MRVAVTVLACLVSSLALAAPEDSSPDPNRIRPLDGVKIEAIETYANPKTSELGIGASFYPFNPYFNSFGVNLNFTHYFGETYAWEVINGNYHFGVRKDLVTDLAENFGVNPEEIETLSFNLNSNFLYIFSYGKLILFKNHIRHFRLAALTGLGAVTTSTATNIAANAGLRLDLYISGSFSVRLDLRENFAFGDVMKSYMIFGLGTGIAF